jgi:hypothetical protein
VTFKKLPPGESNCNTGIGMLPDSIRLLASAIVYLQDYPSRLLEDEEWAT